MTCSKYVVSPTGKEWIEAKVKRFRSEHLREPNSSERFAIKQAWRNHQADTLQRKQARRQHRDICASETYHWQSSAVPRR